MLAASCNRGRAARGRRVVLVQGGPSRQSSLGPRRSHCAPLKGPGPSQRNSQRARPATIVRSICSLRLAYRWHPLKGYGSAGAIAAYTRACELCDELGSETSKSFPALRGLCTGHRARGRMRTASALADQLIEIARRSGDPSLLLEAHHVNWTTQYALGKWRSVCEHTDRGSLPLSARTLLARLRLWRPRLRRVRSCQAGHQPVDAWLSGSGAGPGARIHFPGPPTASSAEFAARSLSRQRACTTSAAMPRRLGKQPRRGFNWRTRYFRPGSPLSNLQLIYDRLPSRAHSRSPNARHRRPAAAAKRSPP